MWSEYALEVVDAVSRNGSFSAAARELHRVPSAISYTVRQLEEWLAVPLFERHHRDVILTPAGEHFIRESRGVIKKMQSTRRQCQQLANGWRGQVSIAVDRIVKPQRMQQLVTDFYRHFPDIELHISEEVFNGVWDALADGRVDMAIGATRAVPVTGRFDFRDMGHLNWRCIVSAGHPLATGEPPGEEKLRAWPSLMLEDTSRALPRRTTWSLDNQRRMPVPDWQTGLDCVRAGLCVAMVPGHLARPLLSRGEARELQLPAPFPESPCCVSWAGERSSPALRWILDYLGDTDTLNQEWLRE
ncbi:DNA-binding transcriptional activator PunR [Tatumella sp. JGM118]|uniref:DNA-binding transcriptional activator PunR n=1 Tax=Tatumella terrea TaxID=419007 RepID=A0ABW1W0W8_9GAMM|nr:DNA-binding transcriptional activator PunR [Tatumella sp. JGM118]MBS0908208.1 LysR family transcriptional regulator [Tatumella sp. JGM118]